MRVHVCAVGRLPPGPEADLTDLYVQRFNRAGRAHNLGPAVISDIQAKKSSKSAEADLLTRAIPKGAWVCALDERGKSLSSDEFAALLVQRRDMGVRDLAFVIGGASGLDQTILAHADMTLSLGPMVWPHALARVLLTEQLYRGVSIISGHPYHKT